MPLLFRFLVSLLVVTLTLSEQVHAAKLVNLGGEFEIFLSSIEGQSIDQIEKAWEAFEARHQKIYDDSVYGKDRPDWETRVRQKRDAFYAKLPTIKGNMLDLFHKADRIVAEKEAQFRTVFPDLAQDIPVIFLPSLSSFNGRVADLPDYGRTGLLMGVDVIVERNDNLNVLFSHEFFHAYHSDKMTDTTWLTMATPLWTEGFATYVSGVLNPNESDDALLMQSDLADLCAKPDEIKKLAQLYLAVIEDGEASYKDWFLASGTTQPVRRGYCLGLQIIRELAKSYTLAEMVLWNESHFTTEIKVVLNKWSSQVKTTALRTH